MTDFNSFSSIYISTNRELNINEYFATFPGQQYLKSSTKLFFLLWGAMNFTGATNTWNLNSCCHFWWSKILFQSHADTCMWAWPVIGWLRAWGTPGWVCCTLTHTLNKQNKHLSKCDYLQDFLTFVVLNILSEKVSLWLV